MKVNDLIERLQQLSEEDRNKPIKVTVDVDDYGGSTIDHDIQGVWVYPMSVNIEHGV